MKEGKDIVRDEKIEARESNHKINHGNGVQGIRRTLEQDGTVKITYKNHTCRNLYGHGCMGNSKTTQKMNDVLNENTVTATKENLALSKDSY